MTPVSCACRVCVNMCRNTTCLPTPEEAKTLTEKYPERMTMYLMVDVPVPVFGPAPRGEITGALRNTVSGQCSFHLPDGRCELHDIGLKPLEGRLAHHDRDYREVRQTILNAWSPGWKYPGLSKPSLI